MQLNSLNQHKLCGTVELSRNTLGLSLRVQRDSFVAICFVGKLKSENPSYYNSPTLACCLVLSAASAAEPETGVSAADLYRPLTAISQL